MSHCIAWRELHSSSCSSFSTHPIFTIWANIILNSESFWPWYSHPNTDLDTLICSVFGTLNYPSSKRCLSSIPVAWHEPVTRTLQLYCVITLPILFSWPARPYFCWSSLRLVKCAKDGGVLKISLNWCTCCCLGELCCTMVARKTEKTVFQGSGTGFWAFRLPC